MVVAVPKTTMLYWSSMSSPKGLIVVMATERGVCWTGTPGTPVDEGFAWLRRRMQIDRVIEGEEIAPLQPAMDELRRYLAGAPFQFTCPLALHGTAFQIMVWVEVCRFLSAISRTSCAISYAIARPILSTA